jgi:hypothetical protein
VEISEIPNSGRAFTIFAVSRLTVMTWPMRRRSCLCQFHFPDAVVEFFALLFDLLERVLRLLLGVDVDFGQTLAGSDEGAEDLDASHHRGHGGDLERLMRYSGTRVRLGSARRPHLARVCFKNGFGLKGKTAQTWAPSSGSPFLQV